MSVADIADVAYAVAVGQLEREVADIRLAWMINGGDEKPPSLADVQAEFDTWLSSEPDDEPAGRPGDLWRRVMGVA